MNDLYVRKLANAIEKMNEDWENGKSVSPSSSDFVRAGVKIAGLDAQDAPEDVVQSVDDLVWNLDCEGTYQQADDPAGEMALDILEELGVE